MDSASSSSAEASSVGHSSDAKPSSELTQAAGSSHEVLAAQPLRTVRLSRWAQTARAYVARVTSMPKVSSTTDSSSSGEKSTSDSQKLKVKVRHNPKFLVRPPSRVARARILFERAKHTIVREAVMPDNVSVKVYYRLMGKSFMNLKDILNKTINLRINSPSPIIPRKRRSSGAGSSTKVFEKPSKKAKKIIV